MTDALKHWGTDGSARVHATTGAHYSSASEYSTQRSCACKPTASRPRSASKHKPAAPRPPGLDRWTQIRRQTNMPSYNLYVSLITCESEIDLESELTFMWMQTSGGPVGPGGGVSRSVVRVFAGEEAYSTVKL